VSFQITVLKVLAGSTEGRLPLVDLRHDVALLISSGRDWTDLTKRIAARAPDLDIFGCEGRSAKGSFGGPDYYPAPIQPPERPRRPALRRPASRGVRINVRARVRGMRPKEASDYRG
jgi:hypothetical protein